MKDNKKLFLENYCHSTENTVDCQIMHLKDICLTFGLPISGAMCFGISEGYDFTYWLDRTSKIPCLIMLGKSQKAIDVFLKKIGVRYKFDTISSESEFENSVENYIKSNHVPLVYADRYYLKYLEQIYNRAHFGNHLISVIGLKKEDNKINFAVYDVVSDDVIWCNSDEIQMARSSLWKPFSPESKIIDVDLNKSNIDYFKEHISDIISDSINNVSDRMLSDKNAGVYAMKALSSELNYLLGSDLKKYSRAISFQMKLIASFIREFEETHSFYRMTYSCFLEEAAAEYGLDFLYSFSERMKEIANHWISMSESISSIKEIDELLNEFSRKLIEASELEKLFFEDLKQSIPESANQHINSKKGETK